MALKLAAIAPARHHRLRTCFYSPGQPRDEKGKWAPTGSHERIVQQNKGTSGKFNDKAFAWAQPQFVSRVRVNPKLLRHVFDPAESRDEQGKWTGSGDAVQHQETIQSLSQLDQGNLPLPTEKLTPSEELAIRNYTTAGEISFDKEESANFDNGLDKIPNYSGRQYRGVIVSALELNQLVKTKSLKLSKSTSFSRSIKIADDFIGNGRTSDVEHNAVIFHLNGPSKGVGLENYSAYKEEREVLHPKGSRFNVIGYFRAAVNAPGSPHVHHFKIQAV